MTRKTRIIASISVSTTDFTDALTNGVESYGTVQAMSGGKLDRSVRPGILERADLLHHTIEFPGGVLGLTGGGTDGP